MRLTAKDVKTLFYGGRHPKVWKEIVALRTRLEKGENTGKVPKAAAPSKPPAQKVVVSQKGKVRGTRLAVEQLDQPPERRFFTTRTWNCLNALGVATWNDFLRLTNSEVFSVRGAGKGTWLEISSVQGKVKRANARRGLALPGEVAQAPPPCDPAPEEDARPAASLEETEDALSECKNLLEKGFGPEAFSCRTWHCLEKLQATNWERFLLLSESQVLSTKSAGRKTWQEISGIQHTLRPFLRTRATGLPPQEGTPPVPDSSPVFDILPGVEGSLDFLKRLPFFSEDPEAAKHCARLDPALQPDMLVGHFSWPKKVMKVLSSLNIRTVGELLDTSAAVLAEEGKIGRTTIEDVRKDLASTLMSYHGTGAADYSTFPALVRSYALPLAGSERNAAIVAEYWGIEPGARPTLEMLGEKHGLTRERIRQILARAEERVSRPASLQFLDTFWTAVDRLMIAAGGALHIEKLAKALSAEFGWEMDSPRQALVTLLERTPAYFLDKGEGLLRDAHLPCAECPEARHLLQEVLERNSSGVHLLDMGAHLAEHCAEHCTLGRQVPSSFSPSFVAWIAKETPSVSIQGDRVLSAHQWTIEHGRCLVDVLQAALTENGEPMYYKKLAEVLRSRNSHYKDVGDRNIHACLSSHADRFLVVARGTYGLQKWGLSHHVSHSDAIIELLRKHNHPLAAWEISGILTKSGKFKECNIHAALSTNPAFIQTDEKHYDLRCRYESSTTTGPKESAKTADDLIIHIDSPPDEAILL